MQCVGGSGAGSGLGRGDSAEDSRSVSSGPSPSQALGYSKDTATITDILCEASRQANETVDKGFANTRDLQRQGEQLQSMDHTLDEMHYKLGLSDRVVRGMSSWTGAVKNWFSSKPKPSKSHSNAVRGETNVRTDPAAQSQRGRCQTQKAQQQQQMELSGQTRSSVGRTESMQKEDLLLDSLLNDVNILREQSLVQRELLSEQNKRLDEFAAKTDDVKSHIKQTNQKVRQLL